MSSTPPPSTKRAAAKPTIKPGAKAAAKSATNRPPTKTRSTATKTRTEATQESADGAASLVSLTRQVRSWADTLLTVTGGAADMGLALAQARAKSPQRKQAIARAGQQLKRWRETAGLTANELSEAVGLGDAQLLEEAEGGLVALPFEVVLRLAGVLGRHDPIPMVLALTRQYNPELWATLENLGIGRLAVQGARERELANLYRGLDAARTLDDEQFAHVLRFTRQAFEMAVDFAQSKR